MAMHVKQKDLAKYSAYEFGLNGVLKSNEHHNLKLIFATLFCHLCKLTQTDHKLQSISPD